MPVTHLDNHASYTASWIKILKDDEKALFSAAAKAEAAAGYLLTRAEQNMNNADEIEEDFDDALPTAA